MSKLNLQNELIRRRLWVSVYLIAARIPGVADGELARIVADNALEDFDARFQKEAEE